MDQGSAAVKYAGDQHSRYGGKLQWPGAHGLPVLGDAAPTLKQHEIDALPVVSQAHEQVFDMNKPEDREYYNWVRDRICNGLFIRDFVERRWDPANNLHLIYMEWRQLFTHIPPAQAWSSYGSARQFTLRPPGES